MFLNFNLDFIEWDLGFSFSWGIVEILEMINFKIDILF